MSEHLSSADLARLRQKLVHQRDSLLANEREARAQRRGVADREIEDGDAAERVIEQNADLRQEAIDGELLAEVERALQKLEAGTYGVSEESGAPIPLERLEAIPWARLTAKEEEEDQHERR